METRAIAKYVRVQPRKVRIIADEVRGKSAVHVAHLLRFHTSKSARALRKVLISAIANAVENNQADAGELKISTITVDEGPRLKRIQARAMGRANRIVKKTSHITVVVQDGDVTTTVKPHGTKAKPRPTFASAKPKKKAAGAKAPKVEEAPAVEETTPVTAEPIVTAEAETPVVAEATPEAEAAPAADTTAAEAEPTPTEETPSEEKGEQS